MSNLEVRVPRADVAFQNYLIVAIPHLEKDFIEPINLMVGAGETVNVLELVNVPPNILLRLENTGIPTAPALYFCITGSETDACVSGSAVQVVVGTPQTLALKQIPDGGEWLYLNVTNPDPANGTSCRITFEKNWKRLGLIEEQMMLLKTKAQAWFSRYAKTLNPATRTTTLVSEKNDLKKDFIEYAIAPLNIIAASINITQEDRNILNLPARDRAPSPRPVITDMPVTALVGMGGGNVKVTNRTSHDASRASIHPDADGVEIRWAIVAASAPAPAFPADCPNSEVLTKAIHTLELTPENASKRLYLFARWRNNSEPAKSGPWNNVQTVVIS